MNNYISNFLKNKLDGAYKKVLTTGVATVIAGCGALPVTPPPHDNPKGVLGTTLLFGDCNGDGRLDVRDATRFGQLYGSDMYDSECDFNGDGRLDVRDATTLGDILRGDITPISECGVLDVPGANYRLMNNAETDGTCFRIVADGVSLDGNGHTISNTARIGDGVYILSDLTGVSVSDLTINNFGTGINAGHSESLSIVGNLLDSNRRGINILIANNGVIKENRILNPTDSAVYLFGVTNSVISGNSISHEWLDLELDFSNNNILSSNSVEDDIRCSDSNDNIDGGGNTYSASNCPWLP